MLREQRTKIRGLAHPNIKRLGEEEESAKHTKKKWLVKEEEVQTNVLGGKLRACVRMRARSAVRCCWEIPEDED